MIVNMGMQDRVEQDRATIYSPIPYADAELKTNLLSVDVFQKSNLLFADVFQKMNPLSADVYQKTSLLYVVAGMRFQETVKLQEG